MATAVGYVQFQPVFGDIESNFQTVERLVRQTAGADLLVLPELALTGYDFRDRGEAAHFAEPFGEGPMSQRLLALARESGATLVMGYPEATPAGAYNACMLATPDGGLFNYRKIHLFSRENELFLPGDQPPPVVDTPAGRVGLMICFDWFYPETARLLALQGAQIIAHPSNLVLQYCQRAMYARSVENHVFTITANRTGTEDRAGRTLHFTGASQVMNPSGEVLVHAPESGEHVGVVNIEPGEADNKQINPYNDLLAGRRVELYGKLLDT